MKRSMARRLGCPVMGVIRAFKVVGCRPDEMGIGPALAIPEALKYAGNHEPTNTIAYTKH